jgi:hypothetical protein
VLFGPTTLWRAGCLASKGMLHMQVFLVWVAVLDRTSQESHATDQRRHLAEGDIHWIAAGAGLSIC